MMSPTSTPAFSAGPPFSTEFDERAAALLQAERLGDVLGHLLDRHADAPARHAALLLQLVDATFIATSIGIANARPM